MNKSIIHWFEKLPLRMVLIIPFVIQIVATVGLVGYLSYKTGQEDVNAVASQLRHEISARVAQRVRSFVAIPHLVNEINANAMRHGDLLMIDDNSRDFLWHQSQLFDSVTAIQFANPTGGQYLGIVRPGPGVPMRFQFRDATTGEFLHFHAINADGSLGDLQRVGDTPYEPRQRPWYVEAVANNGPRWGPIEPAVTVNALAIDASQPAYDDNGELLGVLVVDIFLEQIDDFMEGIEVGETGLTYIIERSGELVADSAAEPAFTIDPETDVPQRVTADGNSNALIQGSAQAILNEFGAYEQVASPSQIAFELDNDRHFLQVTPFSDGLGLDWLIVVVIPEKDFTDQLVANNQNTLIVMIAALFAAIFVGILTARWVTNPILQLNQSAKALAKGNWSQAVATNRRDEVGELALSFNQMAAQLQEAITTLEDRVKERTAALQETRDRLEVRVKERTAELAQTNEQLREAISDYKISEQALRNSEARYRTLVETADDGIVLIDLTGKIIFHNEAFNRNLGFTRSELASQRPLSLVHPDDLPTILTAITQIQASETASQEFRLQHKNGRWVHQLSKSVLVRGDGAEPAGILSIIRDMSEYKLLEMQMRQQDRLAMVGQLASGIAHDFNNILSSITLYADLLHAQAELSPLAQKYLDTITSQSGRGAHMVQQILDFGRRSSMEKQPVDLQKLLDESYHLLQSILPDQIEIAYSHTNANHIIFADPTRIQQVIMNLVLNARDAMPGGGQLEIKLAQLEIAGNGNSQISQLTPGLWEYVVVRDDGTGIADDDVPRLFEPFFTTKAPGKGTGLGLAQAYGIIQQHDGQIFVESAPGVGTTFSIYLPTITTVPEEREPAQPVALVRGQHERVLIVEDNDNARRAIATSLQVVNYEVITALNGREALSLLQQPDSSIQVIVSDMMMPEMSGLELLQALRAAGDNTPFIVLSGNLDPADLEALRASGMYDWMTKPPRLPDLAHMIWRSLKDSGITESSPPPPA